MGRSLAAAQPSRASPNPDPRCNGLWRPADPPDVKLLDSDGRSVPHTAVFSQGFGRDIHPLRFGRRLPEADQLRLGLRARIEPGATRPITVARRERGRVGGGCASSCLAAR